MPVLDEIGRIDAPGAMALLPFAAPVEDAAVGDDAAADEVAVGDNAAEAVGRADAAAGDVAGDPPRGVG